MTRPIPSAVVIGGGIAGIAAAAALRGSCDRVTIIERDDLAAFAGSPRPGVPQSGQLHNLLSGAQEALESLLPGFCDAVRDAGAGVARVAADTEVFELGQRMPLRELGMRLICAPRPTIEEVARSLLLEQGEVRILSRVRAVGLQVAAGRVAGVRVVEAGGRQRLLRAPLVIDASGPRALAFRWLRAAGLEAPAVETRRVRRWYASAPFERSGDGSAQDRFWLVLPTPPSARAGLVSPLDRWRWQVSLSGSCEEEAPRSVAGMRDWAGRLEAPWISELLAGARPLGEPHIFRRRLATWRRYDLLARPVPGLLPIGDAIACLNPLFGQGMSVASMQAAELADLLRRCDWEEACSSAFTGAYLRRSAAVCRAAWELGEMVAAPDAELRAASVLGLAGPLAGKRLRDDAELHRRYVRLWHLLDAVPSSSESRVALGAVA